MGFSRVQTNDSQQLQDIADTLVSAKKVVLITGAGISTSCGIPDFRSQEGLYSLIKTAHGESDSTSGAKGKDLFDCNLWRDPASTQTFYKFISSLRQKIADDVKRTSLTHKLIGKLKEQRKLVRCYTQNIDGLEAREGLSMQLQGGKGNQQRFGRKAMAEIKSSTTAEKGGAHHAGCEVVPLHGDLEELRCTLCSSNTAWTDERNAMMLRGEAPPCPECEEKDMIRIAMGRRGIKVGALRPDIVLYGENHPNTDAIGKITEADLKLKPDVLLVMGTSLKVHGLKTLVREFAKAVHDKKGGKVIFVNLTEPAESVWRDVFDHWVEMECDAWVKDMRQRRKELWMAQSQLESLVTKGAACQHTSNSKKARSAESNRENNHPHTDAPAKHVPLSPPQVAESRGLKRSAPAPDLQPPKTPKRRKPLTPIPTPSSSRQRRAAVPVEDKHAFFEHMDAVVTPESESRQKSTSRRAAAARTLPTPNATPSKKKRSPRVLAVLGRTNAPITLSDEFVSAMTKTRGKARFSIFEDGSSITEEPAEQIVPDSADEGAEGDAQKRIRSLPAQSSKLSWWQSEDSEEIHETIELLSSQPSASSISDGHARKTSRGPKLRGGQSHSYRVANKLHMAVVGQGVIDGRVQTGRRRGSPLPPSMAMSAIV